jgi:hypothetical protein
LGRNLVGEHKKRRQPAGDGALRRRLLIAGGIGVVLIGLTVGLTLLLSSGGPKGVHLIGKWKGAPQARETIKDRTKDTAALVNVATFGMSQEPADDSLATKMVFKKNGTVLFSGKTENLGVPADADGTWEVVQEGKDVTMVRLTVGGASFEARLAFGDKDSFTFTRTDRKETPLLFTRDRD